MFHTLKDYSALIALDEMNSEMQINVKRPKDNLRIVTFPWSVDHLINTLENLGDEVEVDKW